jgi:hypothetical protein
MELVVLRLLQKKVVEFLYSACPAVSCGTDARCWMSLTRTLYDVRQRIMRGFLYFLSIFLLSHVSHLYAYNLQIQTAAKPKTLSLFS